MIYLDYGPLTFWSRELNFHASVKFEIPRPGKVKPTCKILMHAWNLSLRHQLFHAGIRRSNARMTLYVTALDEAMQAPKLLRARAKHFTLAPESELQQDARILLQAATRCRHLKASCNKMHASCCKLQQDARTWKQAATRRVQNVWGRNRWHFACNENTSRCF